LIRFDGRKRQKEREREREREREKGRRALRRERVRLGHRRNFKSSACYDPLSQRELFKAESDAVRCLRLQGYFSFAISARRIITAAAVLRIDFHGQVIYGNRNNSGGKYTRTYTHARRNLRSAVTDFVP